MSFTPQDFVVWTEIPVTNLKSAIAYYEAVTQAKLTIDDTGPMDVANFPTAGTKGVSGHLIEGKPAANGLGPVIHMAASGSLQQVMARIEAAGGRVVSPVITIPPGQFFYSQDPDGNRIGFFTAAA